MIIVLATIDLHPGTRESFLAEFRALVPAVQAEEGCIEYFPAGDHQSGLPTQGRLREEVVVVIEKWDSVEALERHLIAPHMILYRTKVKDFVKGVTLQILSPA